MQTDTEGTASKLSILDASIRGMVSDTVVNIVLFWVHLRTNGNAAGGVKYPVSNKTQPFGPISALLKIYSP